MLVFDMYTRGTVNMRTETILCVCNTLHITPYEILTGGRNSLPIQQTEFWEHLNICNSKDRETAAPKKERPEGRGNAGAGLDRIKEWFPSSRKPATVHRTVAFKLFESVPFIGIKKERGPKAGEVPVPDSMKSGSGSVKPSPAALIRAAFKWVRVRSLHRHQKRERPFGLSLFCIWAYSMIQRCKINDTENNCFCNDSFL